MKKLIYLLIAILVASCSTGIDEIPEEKEDLTNYLENTKWQEYMPMFEDYMFPRYLTFKENGICEYVDSMQSNVVVGQYYYDAVNGEPFQGSYFTKLYIDEAKTNIYEDITVVESLKKLYYFGSWGNTTTMSLYKRIN